MNRTKSKNNLVTADVLRDDMHELAHDARLYARQKVDHLAESMREKSGEVADSTRHVIERGRAAVGNEYEHAIDVVRQNPLAAVSIGFAVGLIFGAMMRGRGN